MNTDSVILQGVISLCKKIFLPFAAFCMRIFTYFQNIFLNSVYNKWIQNIFKGFSKGYQDSLLYSSVAKESVGGDNIFLKFINFIFKILIKIFKPSFDILAKMYKNSVIIKVVSFILENYHRISISVYGLFLFIFSAVCIAVTAAVSGSIDIIMAALAVASLFIIPLNISLAEMVYNISPKLLPHLTEGRLRVEIRQHIYVTVSIAFGTILGISCALSTPFIYVVALIGVLFITVKPKLGIYIVILSFPFIKTMQLAAVISLLLIIYFIRIIRKGQSSFKFNGLDTAIVGMIFLLLFGVINSYAKLNSLSVFMIYTVFILYYFVFSRNITSGKSYFMLVDLMIYIGAIVSLIGFYQKLTGAALNTWTDTGMFEDISGRVFSTFENPNVLGEYLLMCIPLSIARIYMHKSPLQKTAMLFSFAALTVCMILTYSRGCWIGLLVALVIYLAFRFKKITGALIAAGVLVPFVLPESVIIRFLSIGNLADSSTSYRVNIWSGTLKMLKDFWLFGAGIGEKAFNSVYPEYALNSIAAPHPHSLFLLILTQTGILGIAVFLILIFTLYRAISKICKTNSFYGYFAVAVGVGMGGMLIQGIFDNVWYNYRVFLFFFIYIALIPALQNISAKGDNAG